MAHRISYSETNTYQPVSTRDEAVEYAKDIFGLAPNQVAVLRETGSCQTSRGTVNIEEVPEATL